MGEGGNMPATVTKTIDQVIEALGAYLTAFVPVGTTIIQAAQNRVSMPAAPCVVLTPISNTPIEVARQTGTGQTATVTMPAKLDVQVDFYGDDSGSWCRAASGAFRTIYGMGLFPDDIAPLHADDGRQAPMITGESNSI